MKKLILILLATFFIFGCQTDNTNVEGTGEENSSISTQDEGMETPSSEESDDLTLTFNSEKSDYIEELKENNQFKVIITVDGERQEELSEIISVNEDKSLVELLNDTYDIIQEDGFIESIEGFSQEPKENRWWLFTINGNYSEVGADEYLPVAGDIVEFRLSEL